MNRGVEEFINGMVFALVVGTITGIVIISNTEPIKTEPIKTETATLIATWAIGAREQTPGVFVRDFPTQSRCLQVAGELQKMALPPVIVAKCL